MRAVQSHGPMDQRPTIPNTMGQEGSIFVLRRHHGPEPFKRGEISGSGQRDARTATRVGGIGDVIRVVFRHIGNASVLDAPKLLRMPGGIRLKCWRWIDLPAIDAIT